MTTSLSLSVAQAAVDAISSSAVLLDDRGCILTTNRAWRKFSQQNGGAGVEWEAGGNYLTICDDATGANSEGAEKMAVGIRSVIRGDAIKFLYVYPCNSSTQERWFIARVSRLDDAEQVRVLISHEEF